MKTGGKKFVVFPMSSTFKITKNEFNKLTNVRNNNSVYRTEHAQSRSYRIQHARTTEELNAISRELRNNNTNLKKMIVNKRRNLALLTTPIRKTLSPI